MYDDRGKLILYSSDDRGKFKFKNLFGNPFYLFPGFQAFSKQLILNLLEKSQLLALVSLEELKGTTLKNGWQNATF